MLAELAAEFLPDGVLSVVCGSRETGRRLVRDHVPAMVSVAGSVSVGNEVAGAAATDVTRLHLESGGKAPVVVAADADLALAAKGIDQAAFFNAGQDCASACRVIVDQSVHDEFVTALTQEAKGLTTGAPDDPTVFFGPLNVWINFHIPVAAEIPHGGFKHSGYGKDLTSYGLEDYTRIKHVMTYLGS